MKITSEEVILILKTIYADLKNNKDYLNDLDQAIGDGDHGTNVVRGFGAVVEKADSFKELNPKKIMQQVAMRLMSTIGGSSGPLLGSMFLQISNALPDTTETEYKDWVNGFEKGIQAIEMLGKSEPGDKTMLDALVPAINAAKEFENDPKTAAQKAAEAADNGKQLTKDMLAKKGRASYLGERSIGHIDPGAASISIIIKAIYEGGRKWFQS